MTRISISSTPGTWRGMRGKDGRKRLLLVQAGDLDDQLHWALVARCVGAYVSTLALEAAGARIVGRRVVADDEPEGDCAGARAGVGHRLESSGATAALPATAGLGTHPPPFRATLPCVPPRADAARRCSTGELAEDAVGQRQPVRRTCRGDRMLDVGGGPGYFRGAFEDAGARYFALDADVGELSGLGDIASRHGDRQRHAAPVRGRHLRPLLLLQRAGARDRTRGGWPTRWSG